MNSILKKNGIIPYSDISESDIKKVTDEMINFANQEDYKKAKILKEAELKLKEIKKFQENKRHV